jgi:hypothetical protein
VKLVVIGSLVVSVLAIGPKVRVNNPSRERWIFKAIKIRSTPSSEGEVNPSAHVIFYGLEKNPSKYEKDTS